MITEHFSGFAILDEHGNRVGVVDSSVIDRESDVIHYALAWVQRQGFPYGKASMVTTPEKLVPVPWELLSPQLAEEKLVLSADGAMVQEAPGYDRRPRELAGGWDLHVRDYWQVNN